MYRVVLSVSAKRFFEASSKALQGKLDRCLARLGVDPRRHPNIKPLRGRLTGHFRYRVGDYRVVYRIDEPGRLVVVLLIAHRREAYE